MIPGDVRSALEIIYSKKYQDALKVRLAARGEIWTSQQVGHTKVQLVEGLFHDVGVGLSLSNPQKNKVG